MLEQFITITTLVTLWSCPPNTQPTLDNNQCKVVQLSQTSEQPTQVPSPVTPAKQPITYTATSPNTTRSCGHEPSKRNPSGCYDIFTPAI